MPHLEDGSKLKFGGGEKTIKINTVTANGKILGKYTEPAADIEEIKLEGMCDPEAVSTPQWVVMYAFGKTKTPPKKRVLRVFVGLLRLKRMAIDDEEAVADLYVDDPIDADPPPQVAEEFEYIPPDRKKRKGKKNKSKKGKRKKGRGKK